MSVPDDANPQLRTFLAEFADASARATALVAQLTPERAERRPAGGGWTVADNLAHLSLTTEAFLPLLEAAASEGRHLGLSGGGPVGLGLMARILLWFIEPPSRMKVKTSKPFEPVATGSAADELARFSDWQQKLVEAAAALDGLALDRLTVVSPFNASIRYNAAGALALIAAHQRRHLWQAARTAGLE